MSAPYVVELRRTVRSECLAAFWVENWSTEIARVRLVSEDGVVLMAFAVAPGCLYPLGYGLGQEIQPAVFQWEACPGEHLYGEVFTLASDQEVRCGLGLHPVEMFGRPHGVPR